MGESNSFQTPNRIYESQSRLIHERQHPSMHRNQIITLDLSAMVMMMQIWNMYIILAFSFCILGCMLVAMHCSPNLNSKYICFFGHADITSTSNGNRLRIRTTSKCVCRSMIWRCTHNMVLSSRSQCHKLSLMVLIDVYI